MRDSTARRSTVDSNVVYALNAGADPGGGLWGLKTPPPSGPACCISMYDSVKISRQTSAYPPRGVPYPNLYMSHA